MIREKNLLIHMKVFDQTRAFAIGLNKKNLIMLIEKKQGRYFFFFHLIQYKHNDIGKKCLF
jgi:hypothetical protein